MDIDVERLLIFPADYRLISLHAEVRPEFTELCVHMDSTLFAMSRGLNKIQRLVSWLVSLHGINVARMGNIIGRRRRQVEAACFEAYNDK